MFLTLGLVLNRFAETDRCAGLGNTLGLDELARRYQRLQLVVLRLLGCGLVIAYDS